MKNTIALGALLILAACGGNENSDTTDSTNTAVADQKDYSQMLADLSQGTNVSVNYQAVQGEAAKTLTVSVNYPGAADQKAVLMIQSEQGPTTLDTASLVNGHVQLSSDALAYAQPVYVKFNAVRRPFLIFEKAGDIEITIEGEGATMKYTVAGGVYGEVINEYFRIQRQVNTNMDLLNADYVAAMGNGDTATAEELTPIANQIMKVKEERLAALATSAGAFGGLIAAQDLYDSDVDLLEEILVSVPDTERNTPLIEMLDDRVQKMKRVAIGQPFIDIVQQDTTGATVKLSKHLTKFTLVDFWASWCAPCRAENPNVVAAFNKYKDRGFSVVGVSLDENRRNWIKAINSDMLYWTQMSDLAGWSNAGAADYGVRSIPQNVMLDENGIIVAKNLREEALHEWLEENL